LESLFSDGIRVNQKIGILFKARIGLVNFSFFVGYEIMNLENKAMVMFDLEIFKWQF